jgi:hypothetical protein
MLVNYLFLDENDICFEAPLFDTEINNGEIPEFIRNRTDIKKIVTDYTGTVCVGWKWNGTELVDPNPKFIENPNVVGPNIIG